MIDLARAMTDEEMMQAAQYFAAIKWRPRVKVIETALVPKTRIVGNLFLATETERTEPIAGRIIEVPEEEERAERLRDPRSGFLAYVPPGSLARGKQLVRLGGARSSATRSSRERRRRARPVMRPTSWALATFRRSPAGLRATWRARSSTSSRAPPRIGCRSDEAGCGQADADDITAIVALRVVEVPTGRRRTLRRPKSSGPTTLTTTRTVDLRVASPQSRNATRSRTAFSRSPSSPGTR
jgi:hypothetical protein